jgi:hypothetical protein
MKPPEPEKYGMTHWSSGLLGRHLGVSNGVVPEHLVPAPLCQVPRFTAGLPRLVPLRPA